MESFIMFTVTIIIELIIRINMASHTVVKLVQLVNELE